MSQSKTYFPNLNGVRLIAALMVVIAHVEGFTRKAGLFSWIDIPMIRSFGKQGVAVFFVLSGFLITYLLLNEKERFSSISIKKFYIRRILRIWPLYFLILSIGFFVAPNLMNVPYLEGVDVNYWTKFGLCVAMLPNLVYAFFGHVFVIGPLWSVGAEEQFYLVWPHLINRFKAKGFPWFLLTLLVALISVKLSSYIVFVHLGENEVPQLLYQVCKTLSNLIKFDFMVIGGIFAYFAYHKERYTNQMFLPITQILAFVIVPLFWIYDPQWLGLEDAVIGVAYAVIIANLACNDRSLLSLEFPVFNWGGKISYGIYMYHSIIIAIGINWLKPNTILQHVLLYAFSLLGTFTIAYLSYQYLEKGILKYKESFMRVKSGMDQSS